MKIADIVMHRERDGKRFTLFKAAGYREAMTNIYIDLGRCEMPKELAGFDISRIRVEVHVEAPTPKEKPVARPDTWEKHFTEVKRA